MSVTSVNASRLTTGSFPAQSCSACGYATFQGDKFCGGCGGRLLTRAECEQMGGRSNLSAHPGQEVKERSSLSVARPASYGRTQSVPTLPAPAAPSHWGTPRPSPLGGEGCPAAATAAAQSVKAMPRPSSAKAMPRPSSAKALEEKLNMPKRKPGIPKLKKKVGRPSNNNWIQRENMIGLQWTGLMQPRKGEGAADAPVFRQSSAPQPPPLGRAPKDGEW